MDSWEDDPDAQDENLARRAQQSLNFNANSFQPGQGFQPQQYQQYQQYGGAHGQQQGYGGYPQYGQGAQQQYGGQQQQYGGYYQQQNGYNAAQQGQYYQQPQSSFQPPQVQQQQFNQQRVPTIAKRPSAATGQQPATQVPVPSASEAAAKGKTLSIGGDGAPKPKVETTGAAKVLSIGGDAAPTKTKLDTSGSSKVLSINSTTPAVAPTATAKDKVDPQVPAAGSKLAAAKAIEKTGEPTTAANNGNTSPDSSGRNSPSLQEKRAAAREADLVVKEQAADVDEETLKEMYGKEHVNVIFLGHVDAGKSTLGGCILVLTGMVDERTLEKYKIEAKAAGRETWYLSWALDLTKEERAKGKTVEVGRGFFETERRRYSILDAPGHKNFVPSMIGGASQADMGVLVISARKNEFEAGFIKGGQTREHAMLAKTQGVNKLIIAVNKMDDPTVEWSKERYEEIEKKIGSFLKGLGYNPKTDVFFMPISAQLTIGIKERIPKDVCDWYDGPSLLEYLDDMQTLERKVNAPFMMPIAAKYREMGTMIEGKIEAGVIKKGVTYLMMPNKEQTTISALYGEAEEEIEAATCGDQVRMRIRGIEEEDILPGFVLCSPKRPVHCVSAFEAQIVLLDLKSILSAGFNCVMHVHSATEEVTFTQLLHKLEKGTNRKSKKPPGFATKGMSIIARLDVIGGSGTVCVERFEDYNQLGRFTLRDQGQTIAIGKIMKLITEN